MTSHDRLDVCVVGGAGHIGAPLSIVLASSGYRVLVYDINPQSMAQMASGTLPFKEEGGDELLRKALAEKRLFFSSSISYLKNIPYLIVTIGTPVDEYHNPVLDAVTGCLERLLPSLSDTQTLILRSTVFPGMTEHLHDYLAARGKHPMIAFCPERVVQGLAIREIQTLPQIISGTTPRAEESAAQLFGKIAPSLVRMVPSEAEFAKLLCNSYRYIQFAAANQFFMMAQAGGLDFARVMEGLKKDYPRMRDFPRPGLAAGPCLYKDTQQLTAYARNSFGLGNSATMINEGMPAYLVDLLAARHPLKESTVGLLGMAFKADCDDRRASLSYKLKKLLQFRAKRVLTTDPHVYDDPGLVPLTTVVDESDVLVLCTPHSAYAGLDLQGKPILDVWNFFKKPAAAIQAPRRAA